MRCFHHEFILEAKIQFNTGCSTSGCGFELPKNSLRVFKRLSVNFYTGSFLILVQEMGCYF